MNILNSIIEITDPTEQSANRAADRAKEIAKKRGMPDSVIQTAEASAIGATCAEMDAGSYHFHL